MYTHIIRNTQEFKDLQEAWNEALEKSSVKSIFMTWEWLYYWWIHFGGGKELHIVLVKDKEGGRVLGIAPFCLEYIRIGRIITVRRMKLLGTEKVGSDFLDFIVRTGYENDVYDEVCACLRNQKHRWDVLEINDLEEESRTAAQLGAKMRKGSIFLTYPAHACPYISLNGDYAAFLKSLSSAARYDINRKTKKIRDSCEIMIRLNGDGIKIAGQLDELFALHKGSFRIKKYGQNAESGFSGSAVSRFHHDIIQSFTKHGWLKLYLMDYGKRLIGFLYAFSYKNNLFCYQSGFDVSWRKFSPGTVLVSHCLQDIIKAGYREFHYLRGSEGYKTKWTKNVKKTVTISIMNRNPAGVTCAAYLTTRAYMKELRGKYAHIGGSK